MFGYTAIMLDTGNYSCYPLQLFNTIVRSGRYRVPLGTITCGRHIAIASMAAGASGLLGALDTRVLLNMPIFY